MKMFLFLITFAGFCISSQGQSCTCTEPVSNDVNTVLYTLCQCDESYEDASEYCRTRHRGDLATVDDDVTTALLGNLISRTSDPVWVGLKGVKGNWIWVNNGEILREQGCYIDNPGDRAMPHIVRVSDITRRACRVTCRDEGYMYAGLQHAYFCYCGDEYSRYGATSGCTSACGGDPDETCGGQNKNYVLYTHANYSGPWDYDEPSAGALDDRECLVLTCDGSSGVWRSKRCTDTAGYVCLDATDSCREDPSQPGCITLFPGSITWYEAVTSCEARGQQLAEVHGRQTNDVIMSQLQCRGDSTRMYWLGASKVTWAWINGGFPRSFRWGSAYPSQLQDKCVAAKYDTGSGGGGGTGGPGLLWRDVDCTDRLQFVCQYDVPTTTPTTTPAPTTPTTTTPTPPTTTTTATTQAAPPDTTTRTQVPVIPPDQPTTSPASSTSTAGSTTPPGPTGGPIASPDTRNSAAMESSTRETGTVRPDASSGQTTEGSSDSEMPVEAWIGIGAALGIVVIIIIVIFVVFSCKQCRANRKESKMKKFYQAASKRPAFVSDNDFSYYNINVQGKQQVVQVPRSQVQEMGNPNVYVSQAPLAVPGQSEIVRDVTFGPRITDSPVSSQDGGPTQPHRQSQRTQLQPLHLQVPAAGGAVVQGHLTPDGMVTTHGQLTPQGRLSPQGQLAPRSNLYQLQQVTPDGRPVQHMTADGRPVQLVQQVAPGQPHQVVMQPVQQLSPGGTTYVLQRQGVPQQQQQQLQMQQQPELVQQQAKQRQQVQPQQRHLQHRQQRHQHQKHPQQLQKIQQQQKAAASANKPRRSSLYAKKDKKNQRVQGDITRLDVVPHESEVPSIEHGEGSFLDSDASLTPRPLASFHEDPESSQSNTTQEPVEVHAAPVGEVNEGYTTDDEGPQEVRYPTPSSGISDELDDVNKSPGENTIIRRQLIDAGLWRATPEDKTYIDSSIADSAEYVNPHYVMVDIPMDDIPQATHRIASAEDDENGDINSPSYDSVYTPSNVYVNDQNVINLQPTADDSPRKDRIICTVSPLSEQAEDSSASQTLKKKKKKKKANQGAPHTTPQPASNDTINQSQTLSFSDTDFSQSEANTYEDIRSMTSRSNVMSDEEDMCTYL